MAKYNLDKEFVDMAYQRIRGLIVFIFRGTIVVNLLLPIVLLLMVPYPENKGLGYVAFYTLIWAFIPGACVVLAVAAFRKYHGLAVRKYLTVELKWGTRALASYLAVIVAMFFITLLIG
ncbi:MAG: hypothetical protein R2811_07860 [Flavobacteriales bacterium]